MMSFYQTFVVVKEGEMRQLKRVALTLAGCLLTMLLAIAQPRPQHIASVLDDGTRRSVNSQSLVLADIGLCTNPAVFAQTMTVSNAAPSQDFVASHNSFDAEAAEDFTLPIASALSSISVVGMGSTPPDSFLVRIYTNAGTAPDILLYSELFIDPGFSISPTFDLSACPVLSAGRYWVSVQAVANHSIYGQWFWSVASDGVDNPWVIRNPDGGFGMGCTSWGDGALCGFASGAGPGLALIVSSCAANILSAVGPNCRNVNASLDINGNTLFNLSDIITNFPAAAPAKVTISRSFGTPVFGPATVYTGTIIFNACRYLDETLTITVETEGGTCWSNLTFKQLNAPQVEGRNYTVYCFDKFAKTPDLTNRPLAYIPCQAPIDAAYVTDWIESYDCEPGVQDTVKVILREWEAYDKKGRRGFAFDTIVVLQFGEIDADHIYCAEKDTIYCTDTTKRIGPFVTYEDIDLSCDTLWLVNISDKDDDGMLEFHPTVLDSKCGLNVYVNSYKVKGECGNIYRVSVDLKQNCYGPADLTCQVSPPAGIPPNMARQVSPGYWRCEFWLYDLDTIGPDLYCKAVDLFSGPLAFNHWSIIANPNNEPVVGSYFDPLNTIDKSGLPYRLRINSYVDPAPPPLDIDGNQANIGVPDAYYQDAELTWVAPEDQTLELGWTFDLAPFDNILMQNQANLSSLYTLLSFYINVNGVDYPVIEQGDQTVLMANQNSLANVLLTASRDGLLAIPLLKGDSFSLRASWLSPARATMTLYGPNIVSTSSTECAAHTYIPPLYVSDDWSGVKQVKAIVETVGSFILSYDVIDSCWLSHERVKLPKNGEHYTVVYEAYDSCHNFATDSCIIYIKDRIKPVAIMDKGVTISLSDKKVWMDYKAFDEGSWDNCQVNLILLRRADWQESCIDLCDDISPCFVNEHHDTLWLANLASDKEIDEVEAHYATTLKWLCEDDTPCGELIYNAWLYSLMKYATLHCNEHLYGVNQDYFKEKFAEAYYQSDSFRAKFDFCQPEDPNQTTAQRFSPFKPDFGNVVDLYEQLGGGWSDAVAFDCNDACEYVTIEMLVMDYWCNWTKVWNKVKVEDKTPAKVVKEVKDFETITCKSYRDKRFSYPGENHPVNIEFIVDQAKYGHQAAFDKLDQIFGGYQKAWRDEYGNYVDADGSDIAHEIPFIDSMCTCSTKEQQVQVYDEHLGYYWKDSMVTSCYYYDDTLYFKNGIVQVNCQQNVFCQQEVWCEFDHCGQGYLHRKFKIWQTCPDSFYVDHEGANSSAHDVDTIVRHQRIYVGSECELNKYMFDVPGDMTIEACGVQYDASGNVMGDAGPENTGYPKYKMDDDCRIVGIGHKDKVFKIVGGEEPCYKVVRTWYFADWCGTGGEPLRKNWWEDYSLVVDSCIQKIFVIDQTSPVCSIVGPVMDGDTIEMGACAYNLKVQIKAEDLCGLTNYYWEVGSLANLGNSKIYNSGNGSLKGTEENFSLTARDLLPGTYRLKVYLEDECNNESGCFYNFSIKSVKKPTPICYTSLTVRLTPWDRDQNGSVDTAHAIIWASEFDRSSSPTCGDDSLDFRLELLDGSSDDATPVGDLDFLELGCDHIGTRLVRLWVISYPSQTIDYCDAVLVVQSDYTGCSTTANGDANEFEKMQNSSNYLSHKKFQENSDKTEGAVDLSVNGLIGNDINSEIIHLEQNNPNPFMTETSIAFSLPRAMQAKLTIFDINGKIVRSYSGLFKQGINQVSIQREELPVTSVLFYRLDAQNYSDVKRMVLIK